MIEVDFMDFTWDVNVLLIDDACMPVRKTPGSSGFDLTSRVDFDVTNFEEVEFWPEEWRDRKKYMIRIPLGVSFSFHKRLEGQVRPRSSTAGYILHGTIDSDYRGEVFAQMHESRLMSIKKGDRIAQIVFKFVPAVSLTRVGVLDTTARGSGGFGHTGQ